MYCTKCGSQVNTSLNYCNICGAKMAKETVKEGKFSPLNGLITTLSFVALGGLGILVGFIAMLLKKGMTHEAIAIIALFYLATLFGICFSIIRLMSKLIDANSAKNINTAETSRTEVSQTPLLSMPTNPQLNEYKQPIGSVTDHTTRTFDEAFVKRN
jgi:hypothetical protein